MKLVIVESPTKVKTITKYLGKDYKIMASYGHIRDLAMTGKNNLGVDIENDFKPDYQIYDKSQANITRLKKAKEECDEVLLATDPDREGEAISWHLAQVLDLDIDTTKRLEFHEITKYGIENAINNPRTLDMNLIHSQETRRIIDRIMGFELSGLLQRKIHSKSAGRVQSAVLKLICDQEEKVTSFKKEEYYNLFIIVKDGRLTHKAQLKKYQNKDIDIKSEKEANLIASNLNGEINVSNIEEEEKDYFPPYPFTTSSMQQEAFNILGFTTKKTMKLAQDLYEQGYITYMRTDSIRLSPLFISAAKKEIEQYFGPTYVGKAYVQKSKDGVQDAHEAIRPTDARKHPKDVEDQLSADEFKLYQLIYRRAVASIMKARHQLNSKVTLTKDDYEFNLEGSKVLFDGYQKLYNPRNKKIEEFKYNFNKGDNLTIKDVETKQEFTKSPSRYSEAKLVKLMEEEGVGRPSTYASTIDTLKARGYIEIKKGVVYPTVQGILTSSRLTEFFAKMVDVKFTASMETDLDEVAKGNAKELDLLKMFNDVFTEELEYATKHMKEEQTPIETLTDVCPICGSPLVKKKSRKGTEFIGCSNYPNCNYIKPDDKAVHLEGEGEVCPNCGVGHLVTRKGKFGYFLACSEYPKCSYIHKGSQKKVTKTKEKIFKSRKKKEQ